MILNIKNNSQQQEVYIAMFGIDNDLNWCLYNFTSNTLDVCVTGATDAKQYLMPLSSGLTVSDMPALSSGIILFSYNEWPNDFAVVPDANGIATVQSPSFLSSTTDYHTTFNMVEFTYSGSAFVDITNVDFFSTPITLDLVGKQNDGTKYHETKGEMTVGRHKVFEGFETAVSGTVFDKLVIKNKSGSNVRILGPQHGVDSGLIPTDFFDDYINQCWKFYEVNTLNVKTSLATYQCVVEPPANIMFFKLNGADVGFLSKPSPNKASDIFGCVGILDAPNNEFGAVVARIGAAINRTNLLLSDHQPDCNEKYYYTVSGKCNLYAKVLHTFYKDGTTYAFPFDDVCGGSSTLSCQVPEVTTITLEEF